MKHLIENHEKYTGSTVARVILGEWETAIDQFTKVMPRDYKRALREMAEEEAKQKKTNMAFGTQL